MEKVINQTLAALLNPEIHSSDKTFIPLCLFSFFIEMTSIFHTVVILYIFTKISTIHLNMRLACCNLWICIIIRSILRMIILIHFILGCNLIIQTNYGIWINFFHGVCNCCTYFLEISIFGERIFSSLFSRIYERFFSYYFLALLLITPWILAIGLSYGVVVAAIFHTMTSNYILITLFSITWMTFLAVLRIVKYLNKRSPHDPTLSERYQQVENFRTNKTMFWIGAASIALIIVSLICQGAKSIYFSVDGAHEKHMTAVFNVILNIGIGSCLLLMPLAFIFTNDRVYLRYISIFYCLPFISRRNIISPQPRHPQIKSVTGKSLVFENEQNFYFISLIQEWDKVYEKMLSKKSRLNIKNKYIV